MTAFGPGGGDSAREVLLVAAQGVETPHERMASRFLPA